MTHATPARRYIAPGATLGVLGGGQLGRMFAQAAQQMGYAVAVLDPDADGPAVQVAQQRVTRAYDDAEGLARLAEIAAAVTTEFENVPAAALADLARRRPVAPSAAAVAVCQDRAAEKAQFERCGIACAPHAVVDSTETLAALDAALLPGVLKTARLGYDGHGQRHVTDRAALEAAWHELRRAPCVLEQWLPLACEISVIVARGADGQSVHLPVQQNLHREGILAITRVPAPDVADEQQRAAIAAAQRLADTLDYVGVLCVEFFVLQDGRLLANEMAPRPHNSGHWSLDGCDVSQFELQVRTLTGAPLVQARLHSACVMLNLLGELWLTGDAAAPDWPSLLALPGVHLHLYGKATPRPGRKMGHLTVTAASAEQADAVAREAAKRLGIEGW